MPGGNGSGPLGQGARTGREMGTCVGSSKTFSNFFGFGRGRGKGLGRMKFWTLRQEQINRKEK